MRFPYEPFRPFLDPNDEGGAGDDESQETDDSTQDDEGQEGGGDESQQAEGSVTLDVSRAQREMQEQQLNNRISTLEAELAKVGSTIANAAGEKKREKVDEDEFADDPAMKRLIKMESGLLEEIKAIRGEVASIKQDVELGKKSRARESVTDLTSNWIEQDVIGRNPALKGNEAACNLLRKHVGAWQKNAFNPEGDIRAQINSFQLGVKEWLDDHAPLLGAGGSKAPPKEKLDKRAAAIERDKNAKASLSAAGGAPPSVEATDETVTAGSLYADYMETWEAQHGTAKSGRR